MQLKKKNYVIDQIYCAMHGFNMDFVSKFKENVASYIKIQYFMRGGRFFHTIWVTLDLRQAGISYLALKFIAIVN